VLRYGSSRRGSCRIVNDVTLKAAALKLSFVTAGEFDRVVDPKKTFDPTSDCGCLTHVCIEMRNELELAWPVGPTLSFDRICGFG
jgi:hypothetical protein